MADTSEYRFTVRRIKDGHTFAAKMLLGKPRVRIQLENWCVWLTDAQFACEYEIPREYQKLIAQHYRRILNDSQHVGISP